MRKIMLTTIFFITIFYLSAQTPGGTVKRTYNANLPVDFEITLKSLFQKVSKGDSNTIPTDKYIVISGTVSAREILNPDKENFSGILELSAGEWKGTSNITIYRCYVQLNGSEFAPMIPVRRSRKPNPREISLNTKVLILGKYIGYSEDKDGSKYPVIAGISVRKEK